MFLLPGNAVEITNVNEQRQRVRLDAGDSTRWCSSRRRTDEKRAETRVGITTLVFVLATGADGRHAMLPVHGNFCVGGPPSGG